MAMSVGMMGLTPAGASSAASVVPGAGTSRASKGRRIGCGGVNVRCAAVGAARLTEQYLTLRIQPGASEKQVKKAFRLLALQYHPDVCKGSNCSVRFDQINEAYDTVMSNLKEEQEQCQEWSDEETSWGELWEEWMGWEGAGIRDYSSHINPYI